MKRFILSLCVGLSLSAPVHAADITILPIPARMSQMKFEDYIDALKLSKQHSAGNLMISLWTWQKLEPGEGDSAVEHELGGLNYAVKETGFMPYCGVTVIDTVDRKLPDDLEDLAWDDPQLLVRYAKILDEVKRNLAQPPLYFLIANEADVYFEKHPEEFPAFLTFAAGAKRAVRQRFPEAVIGMTGTFEGLQRGGERAKRIAQLVDVSDAAFFTYYPVMDFKLSKPAEAPGQLDAMIAAAGQKDVILQEIGYPSTLRASSPEQQADFFSVAIPAIAARPRIKIASIFAMHDFDEKTCDMFTGYYGFESLLAAPWKKDFKAFLCSLGLRDAEGNPKPAWDAATKAMAKIKGEAP